MKTEKPSIPFETNAEIRTVSGWCCKTCSRFWGDGDSGERAAKYCCCTDRLCEKCGVTRAHKHYIMCEGCRHLDRVKRFEKLESKPYDGTAVVLWDGDRYFYDSEELLDWIEDTDDGEPRDLKELRFVFAEMIRPSWRLTVSELLVDDLPEDDEWDTSEIDKQIETWVEKNAPNVYWPSKIAVTQQSIIDLVQSEARTPDISDQHKEGPNG